MRTHLIHGTTFALTATICFAAAPAGDDVKSGYIAAPQGSQVLSANLPEDTIHLYKDKGFEGNEATVAGLTLANTPGVAHELPDGLNDDLTALRWNLPAGVAVVFYEDAGGRGEQLAIWGKGQIDTVEPWDINDKISRWAWFYVGGADAPASHVRTAESAGPLNARALSTILPDNSLQLYKDKDYRGDMVPVAPAATGKAGELHALTGPMSDSMTSLRWNLPPGVIVTFYQDAGGLKQQAAIWGKGELANVDLWDFNDKVSRWSWSYIGSPAMRTVTPERP